MGKERPVAEDKGIEDRSAWKIDIDGLIYRAIPKEENTPLE
jgi:hypothetical protein